MKGLSEGYKRAVDQNWGRICLDGSFGALLVGGCGARAVSRKAPVYFIYNFCYTKKLIPSNAFKPRVISIEIYITLYMASVAQTPPHHYMENEFLLEYE